MKLEYIILGLLSMQSRTGYDLKKYLDTEGRFGRARAPLSQIYTTLKRMHANVWVTFEEEVREGRPDLKIYSITDRGKQELISHLETPADPAFRFKESDIIYRLMFSFLIDPQVMLHQVQTELDYRRNQIATYRHRDLTIQATNLNPDQTAKAQEIFEVIHSFGARAIDNYVQTLEEIIYFLEKKVEQKIGVG